MAASTSPNGRSATPHPALVKLIPLELGGATRHLLFDFNAMALVEEVTGQNVLAMGGLAGNWSATLLSATIWASMLHESPELGERDSEGKYPGLYQVRSWITLDRTIDCINAVRDAVLAALPTAEQLADPNSPSPSEATGA
jgi:hypothetical protein